MRKTIGSIIRGKKKEDGTSAPDYIKISQDVTLKKGQFLNLESKQQQITSIQEGIKAGRLDEEKGNRMLERANNIPDFVRFDIVANEKKTDGQA